MSRFDCVESAPAIEIFALSKAYKEDQFPQKVDLGIGGISQCHSYLQFVSMAFIVFMDSLSDK